MMMMMMVGDGYDGSRNDEKQHAVDEFTLMEAEIAQQR